MLEAVYRDRCNGLGVKPVPVSLTDQEREYSLLVPRRSFKVYSPDAQKRQEAAGQGQRGGQAARATAGRGETPPPEGQQPAQRGGGRGRQPGLPGLSSAEVANFIDGSRSILDIYNAVRAECGNLVTGNSDMKFAYVLSPDAPDVELPAVVTTLRTLEKAGTVEIVKKAAGSVRKK